jgi:putative endonuclease
MTKESSLWFVYMIQTACGKLYTGITTDIARRFQEHSEVYSASNNKGAKFFRGHEPQKVIYFEECSDRSSASKREYQIKSLSVLKKRNLIEKMSALKT